MVLSLTSAILILTRNVTFRHVLQNNIQQFGDRAIKFTPPPAPSHTYSAYKPSQLFPHLTHPPTDSSLPQPSQSDSLSRVHLTHISSQICHMYFGSTPQQSASPLASSARYGRDAFRLEWVSADSSGCATERRH